MLQAVENLLLGFVTDGAGVVKDVVRLLRRLHLRIAFVQQRARHLFGVVGIHLAAKSLDVKRFFHWNHCTGTIRSHFLHKSRAKKFS